ncbi:MAG: T9SS type A sorting domain-containing protein [Bacteroidetes bacterium]|nr:T9SS type A sorting domain-containing protein [Bacteroidota bacterium]
MYHNRKLSDLEWNCRVQYFRATGFVPIHEIKNGEYQEINTSSLTPGVYLLELRSGMGKVVRRFVKE